MGGPINHGKPSVMHKNRLCFMGGPAKAQTIEECMEAAPNPTANFNCRLTKFHNLFTLLG